VTSARARELPYELQQVIAQRRKVEQPQLIVKQAPRRMPCTECLDLFGHSGHAADFLVYFWRCDRRLAVSVCGPRFAAACKRILKDEGL
jgi:hypothetical protein